MYVEIYNKDQKLKGEEFFTSAQLITILCKSPSFQRVNEKGYSYANVDYKLHPSADFIKYFYDKTDLFFRENVPGFGFEHTFFDAYDMLEDDKKRYLTNKITDKMIEENLPAEDFKNVAGWFCPKDSLYFLTIGGSHVVVFAIDCNKEPEQLIQTLNTVLKIKGSDNHLKLYKERPLSDNELKGKYLMDRGFLTITRDEFNRLQEKVYEAGFNRIYTNTRLDLLLTDISMEDIKKHCPMDKPLPSANPIHLDGKTLHVFLLVDNHPQWIIVI